MNLNFLHLLNYLYFTSYWGGSVASAVGATGEDVGCSLPGGTTFASDAGLHSIRRLGDVLLAHAFSHARTASLHHPLRGDLLCHQLCMWQQALPKRMDGVRALAVGVPAVDGGEVQVRVVRRHRSQHPRCPVEHPISDEHPNFVRDLR